MSYQRRRRGQEIGVYKKRTVRDARGNVTITVNMDVPPIPERAAIVPDRGSRAELPGQQQIDVYRVLVDMDVPDLHSWARITWAGDDWDVIAPPEIRTGVRRHTRHQTILIRRRP